MRGLIDSAAGQEHQIAMIWQAIEKLNLSSSGANTLPPDAARTEQFEADKLNQLLNK